MGNCCFYSVVHILHIQRYTKFFGKSRRAIELIVNPTLLTLVNQRGQIDCGGMEYVLIRYGNFFQLVYPIVGGHLSVAIQPRAQPLDLLDKIRQLLVGNGLKIDIP
jgi:hypothetical protein